MIPSEDIEILNYSDFNALQKRKPFPYHVEIINDNQNLFYWGGHHINDPSHFQYTDLDNYWKKFLSYNSHSKDIVILTEGGIYPPSESKEKAISGGGEGQYITYLAQNTNLPVKYDSPDKEEVRSSIISQLLKTYSVIEIAYYEFASLMNSWNSINDPTKSNYENFINSYLKSLTYLQNNDHKVLTTLQDMVDFHKNYFKSDIDLFNQDFFYSIVDPTIDQTLINRISIDYSILRDKAVVEMIYHYWQRKFSISVVYSNFHAIVEEPAIRELLAN